MIGILLIGIGTFFQEVSDSIGKIKVKIHEESPYTMAFLSVFWWAIFLALIAIVKHSTFTFSIESLPTFSVRAILEIFQLYVCTYAIIKAERSTYNFIRTGTIPLLLIVDLILWYSIGTTAIIGIIIVMISLWILLFNREIKKGGIRLVVLSTINAVFTISLYKYDITHFNSIVGEQLVMYTILLISFFIFDRIKFKENPMSFLNKRIFLVQSLAIWIGGIIQDFAYYYGAASIITTAKRWLAIIRSMITGKIYFKEKHVMVRIYILIPLILWLILLII